LLQPVDLHQISSELQTMSSTPPPPPQVVSSKIAQTKMSEQTQGRGPAFVFIEILCTLLTVSVVNNRLCDGRNKRDRFAHFNDTYKAAMHRHSGFILKSWCRPGRGRLG
jgi:hypothetical protein